MNGDDIYAFVDLTIGFRASVLDPSMMINGSSLQISNGGAILSWMNDGSYDNGTFIHTKASDTSLANLGEMEAEFSMSDTLSKTNISGSTSFTPQNEIWITDNILVWARDSTDSAELSAFEQRFSQTSVPIPEPTTIYLLGLSFLCLGFARLRHS